jgi:hypothetical protein
VQVVVVEETEDEIEEGTKVNGILLDEGDSHHHIFNGFVTGENVDVSPSVHGFRQTANFNIVSERNPVKVEKKKEDGLKES